MKKHLLAAFLFVALLCGSAALTSCGDDNYYWDPVSPPGWQTVKDSRLYGCWQLIQYNSQAVTGDKTNYMEFNSTGRGYYYYYDKGVLIQESIAYWCQPGGNASSNYQINVKYEDGTASTMNYWFTDNNTILWLQWHTSSGAVTYAYKLVNAIP